MNVRQLPLPGFDYEPIVEKVGTMTALLIMHTVLRDDMRQLFDHEIEVLRAMGKLNAAQCSDEMYAEQRKLCQAIKEVVIRLDIMNDYQQNGGTNE